MITEIQTLYQEAIKFAAGKHKNQKVPGTDIPYVVHLSNVAMEIFMAARNTSNFNLAFSIQVALLESSSPAIHLGQPEEEKIPGRSQADLE